MTKPGVETLDRANNGSAMSDQKTFLLPVTGGGQRPEDVTEEMAERLKEVIYDYAGRTTLAAAVGVLHIVALEIMEASR